MKIRCVENSIRYRLRKSDITQLRAVGSTSNQVGFGMSSTFKYTLAVGHEEQIAASFQEGEILVLLPQGVFEQWADSQEVSIEKTLQLDGDENLHLLIEKDFPCKDREEDITDTFFELNPNDSC